MHNEEVTAILVEGKPMKAKEEEKRRRRDAVCCCRTTPA